MKLNIGASFIRRWNREAEAEAGTPWLVQKPEKRGYRWRVLRAGVLHVMDWGEGPQLDMGAGTTYRLDALAMFRIPTDADAVNIAAALAAIEAARRQAEKVYAKAWTRGRQPTLDDIRAAEAYVKEVVGDA